MSPKLSPQEKRALKQHIKLLKKLGKIEAAKQVKRDELSRELEYGRLSRKKLEESWVDTLKKLKIPELKIDLELCINQTQRMLDIKDYTISLLLDELDEAEDQYAHNFKAHCENMHKLYKLYLDRLNELKIEYVKEIMLLTNSTNEQFEKLNEAEKKEEKYMKTMIFQLGAIDKDLQSKEKVTYLSKNKEMIAKCVHTTTVKSKFCEDEFEKVWREITKTLENYNAYSTETMAEYKERSIKNDMISNIIRQQTEDIFNSQTGVKIVREKQKIQKETVAASIETLNKELRFLQNIVHSLIKTFNSDTSYDDKIILSLVTESNGTIKKLESIVNSAEKIMTLNSIVKKFETRREKILAFPRLSGKKPKENHLWGNKKNLVPFWQKCGMADTIRKAIQCELDVLQKENSSLKRTITACLSNACNAVVPDVKLIDKAAKKSIYVYKA